MMEQPSLPTREDELADVIADAAREGVRLAITGGGSKSGFGAPIEARPLSMRGFAGVVDYDPAELVLTVRVGTPLAEVEALVAEQNQMLAFEPFDHGPIYGAPAGAATIGGTVAAGVAGSQRLSHGGARDHLLGFRAVSGRGEPFVAGAKVVKNVTGYDLPKLAAGSWGRLFAMTEVTLKVLPHPRAYATRAIEGLDEAQAVKAMAVAMGSQAEIAAAAHLPGCGRNGRALTAFRIQGVGPSVAARGAMLDTLLAAFGKVEALDETEGKRVWDGLRTLSPLPANQPLWRINVAPSASLAVVSALRPLGAQWLFDWAGGLIWMTFDGDPQAVRAAAAAAGGHATLARAPAATRAAVPAFHPQAPGVAALEERVRRAFDPARLFETGRF
ncbi:glycolate oxidase subunit GlcE [Sphingobium sp. Cam5-1]|uniref:glycolate oxidase subunit GlcE n=1 Tax=Sphingobium sp. Cam5-1 TaxID=2789327 RepID=UPI001E345072|nr:glycolate oxidase subunit GlcE [Sphingobium sp. Cam5-1]